MSTMASQITSLTIVYSTVYSSADQRKHQSSASLAFVWGIHRWPVNSPHKGSVTWKMFPFDDIIMETRSEGYWPDFLRSVIFRFFRIIKTLVAYIEQHSNFDRYDIRNNLEHFGDDAFNPLNTGFIFFYFLGLCLLPALWNNRWMDIHEIFRIWTQEGIG